MSYIRCSRCKKVLIERLPNGLWRFKFGRIDGSVDNSIVDMEIHGSVKIKCLRKSCRQVNVFNFFPTVSNELSERKNRFMTHIN